MKTLGKERADLVLELIMAKMAADMRRDGLVKFRNDGKRPAQKGRPLGSCLGQAYDRSEHLLFLVILNYLASIQGLTQQA